MVYFFGLLDPTAFIYWVHIEPIIQGLYILYTMVYGFNAMLFLFYSLAEFLANVRWRWQKTVVYGLCSILWSLVFVIVLSDIAHSS